MHTINIEGVAAQIPPAHNAKQPFTRVEGKPPIGLLSSCSKSSIYQAFRVSTLKH